MAMVGMVLPVTNSPSMIRHKDGSVSDVPNQIIECPVIAEALMTAAHITITCKIYLHWKEVLDPDCNTEGGCGEIHPEYTT
jgi:hypothetical protein